MHRLFDEYMTYEIVTIPTKKNPKGNVSVHSQL